MVKAIAVQPMENLGVHRPLTTDLPPLHRTHSNSQGMPRWACVHLREEFRTAPHRVALEGIPPIHRTLRAICIACEAAVHLRTTIGCTADSARRMAD